MEAEAGTSTHAVPELKWLKEVPGNKSNYFTQDEIDSVGRKFYQSVRHNKAIIRLNDCVAVQTDDDQTEEDSETARVLAMWEDTEGEDAGVLMFKARWLFAPEHLDPRMKEFKRKRQGLDLKELYEGCDETVEADANPLESVFRKKIVLCKWKSKKNRFPLDSELQTADNFVAFAYDSQNGRTVKFDQVVDKDAAYLEEAGFVNITSKQICQQPEVPAAKSPPAKPSPASRPLATEAQPASTSAAKNTADQIPATLRKQQTETSSTPLASTSQPDSMKSKMDSVKSKTDSKSKPKKTDPNSKPKPKADSKPKEAKTPNQPKKVKPPKAESSMSESANQVEGSGLETSKKATKLESKKKSSQSPKPPAAKSEAVGSTPSPLLKPPHLPPPLDDGDTDDSDNTDDTDDTDDSDDTDDDDDDAPLGSKVKPQISALKSSKSTKPKSAKVPASKKEEDSEPKTGSQKNRLPGATKREENPTKKPSTSSSPQVESLKKSSSKKSGQEKKTDSAVVDSDEDDDVVRKEGKSGRETQDSDKNGRSDSDASPDVAVKRGRYVVEESSSEEENEHETADKKISATEKTSPGTATEEIPKSDSKASEQKQKENSAEQKVGGESAAAAASNEMSEEELKKLRRERVKAKLLSQTAKEESEKMSRLERVRMKFQAQNDHNPKEIVEKAENQGTGATPSPSATLRTPPPTTTPPPQLNTERLNKPSQSKIAESILNVTGDSVSKNESNTEKSIHWKPKVKTDSGTAKDSSQREAIRSDTKAAPAAVKIPKKRSAPVIDKVFREDESASPDVEGPKKASLKRRAHSASILADLGPLKAKSDGPSVKSANPMLPPSMKRPDHPLEPTEDPFQVSESDNTQWQAKHEAEEEYQPGGALKRKQVPEEPKGTIPGFRVPKKPRKFLGVGSATHGDGPVVGSSSWGSGLANPTSPPEEARGKSSGGVTAGTGDAILQLTCLPLHLTSKALQEALGKHKEKIGLRSVSLEEYDWTNHVASKGWAHIILQKKPTEQAGLEDMCLRQVSNDPASSASTSAEIPRPLLLRTRPPKSTFHGHFGGGYVKGNSELVTHFSQPNTSEYNMAKDWRLLRCQQKIQKLKLTTDHWRERGLVCMEFEVASRLEDDPVQGLEDWIKLHQDESGKGPAVRYEERNSSTDLGSAFTVNCKFHPTGFFEASQQVLTVTSSISPSIVEAKNDAAKKMAQRLDII